MKKEVKRLLACLSAIGLSTVTTHTIAGGAYQIWEQDAAGVGNFHAGRAAEAEDASVAFYNPGGINHIKNKQLVLGAVWISTSAQFRGTVATNTFLGNVPQRVNVDGGGDSIVPDLHYVQPLNDKWGIGFSVVVPFGLGTDYGLTTPMKYAAYRSILRVVDVSPSIAYSFNPCLSAGFGVDLQRGSAQLSQVGTLAGLESVGTNNATDTAYGFHAGLLYQTNPATRFGVAFHSKVVHHFKGTSKLVGNLADTFNGGLPIVSENLRTNLALPPYTTSAEGVVEP